MTHISQISTETCVSNKKDELFNAILEWFIKDGLCWQPHEVENGTAKNTIRTLYEVLWYLDGHHATLAERSCHVPSICRIQPARKVET